VKTFFRHIKGSQISLEEERIWSRPSEAAGGEGGMTLITCRMADFSIMNSSHKTYPHKKEKNVKTGFEGSQLGFRCRNEGEEDAMTL
jgi:hypothetical protein